MAGLNPAWRLPAEWEPHDATWIAWPHERSDWPGKFAPIPWVYGDIVRHLSRVETVRILVRDARDQRAARRVFEKSGANLDRVEFHECATNRSWVRDTAPFFVKNSVGQVAAVDWHFNAWAKYSDWQLDDHVPSVIARKRKMHRWEPVYGRHRVVLEGGAVDSNGQGRLLVTEECLLSEVQARNPGLSREDYAAVFHEHLGVEDVIWLGRGIEGDDTHGHVDDLARFVSPDTAVCLEHEDCVQRLKQRGLRVMMLPQPQPVYFNGQLLPASYANFYIANELVLVPMFSDPADRVALNTLVKLFPDREVIGIGCRDLVLGLGSLHCMTMQEPA